MEGIIFDGKVREMINVFWEDCNEPSFYRRICQPDNFLCLNGRNVIYPRVIEIVMNYIEVDENNFNKLKRNLIKNQKIFQYIYVSVYPEVYSFVDKRGVDMRNNFHLKLKVNLNLRYRKNLSRMRTEKGEKLLKSKSKKRWKRKNKKRESRLEIAAKNK